MRKSEKEKSFARVRASLVRGGDIGKTVGILAPEAVGVQEVLKAGKEIQFVTGGVGPILQPLFDQRDVTDVLINGSKGVWVDRGEGLVRDEQASRALVREEDVRALAVRLAARCGQRLDDASPIVDGTFSFGLRLHAVLPPLGAEGTLISLRAHRSVSFSLRELSRRGMCDARIESLIHTMVDRRANVVISGATGSGKTTLLSAILGEISAKERILVIEESAELRPCHPHVVHLQIRRPNVQGKGEVAMDELVRAAMRMRPDRIVLGECRGREVREVLAALNTGHEGGWATIHANSVKDVPARLIALGALGGMSESAVAAQAVSALDALIHVEKKEGVRRVAEIGVLRRVGGELKAEIALKCRNGWVEEGPAWENFAQRFAQDEAPKQR